MSKKILIIGGASGLGKSITEQLAKENDLYITYHNSAESANDLATKYNQVKAVKLDLNSNEDLSTIKSLMEEQEIEIIINNAITQLQAMHAFKVSKQALIEGFSSNIAPLIDITHHFIKLRKKAKTGRIITLLTSYIINKPPLGMATYAAEKSYLHSFVKSWASEYAQFGIVSNAISPSIMQTGLTENTDERVWEQIVENSPNKEILPTRDVAETVEFLVNCSPHINGVNIVINQGENVI